MRSILLIFLTVVLIAAGFFAYLWFQPQPKQAAADGSGETSAPVAVTPASRPVEAPDPNLMNGGGTSTNIYVKTIDEKTGELSNEFRAVKFEPRKDGTVDVTEPEAKFYLAKSENGQVLVIKGKTGKVIVPDSQQKRTPQMKSSGATAPTRGNLQDVTVLIFDRPDAPEPTLTCTMNNASFDQETFRIQTESYEYNGKVIPADQVEVQVRGKDYDFDGKGLDIRWNERDRRLQTLEVAHGERLTVKHPQAIKSMTGATTAPSAMVPTQDFRPESVSMNPWNVIPSILARDLGTETTPLQARDPSRSTARDDNSWRLPSSERFSTKDLASAWMQDASRSTAQHDMWRLPLSDALASADPAAAGDAIKSTPTPSPMPAPRKKKKPTSAPVVAPVKIVRDKTAPIFRATFLDNVKIVQNDLPLATAKQMDVDFVMESEKSTTQPSTAPTTAPANADAKADSAAPKSLATVSRSAKNKPATQASSKSPAQAPANPPATAPVAIAVAEKKRPKHAEPTTGSTTAPATQPDEAPITIYWTGRLLVTPLDAETQDPPTKQDAIVTLTGEPVVLKRGNGEVDCALVRYHTQDSTTRMESSKLTPMITMKDDTGSVLHTPTLDYSGAEGIAILRGASQADLLMKNEATTQPSTVATTTPPPTTQPQMVHASWTRTCRLFLSPGESREQMTIERAEIDGDVTIDHPQVKGRSDTLELAFEKVPTTHPSSTDPNQPSTELSVKTVDADGKVHYVVTSEQSSAPTTQPKSQTIDCSHLTIETARDKNNKTYASAMNADGSVHAFDDTQDMHCGQLAVKFEPTTKPSTQPADPSKLDTASIQIESLLARQDVRLKSADGNAATADQIEMLTKDGVREVTLFGHPMATVTQKDSHLTGPIIKFDPDSNRAYVVGAGTMHAVQVAQDATDKKSKPQPMDMTWAGNLKADGDINLIDVTDKVAINAKTSDGAQNTATSDRLKLTLMDDPKAATRPSFPTTQKTKKPNSSMAASGFGDSNFFKDKVVKVVELQDNVVLDSVLNDSKGKLLRRMHMEAPLVQYYMQDKLFVVPRPGAMLMQDVSKNKSTATDTGSDATPSDMGGATVFRWMKELRYDEAGKRMTMSGDCHIVHESNGDNKPFTLDCQTIIADLEPVPVADSTTQPSTTPSAAPATTQADAGANQKMRLKHVTASDQVVFISSTIHFEATNIDYDPNTHVLIAKGSDRVRAQLYDEKGALSGSFKELHYNTQTGRVDQTLDMRGTVRK